MKYIVLLLMMIIRSSGAMAQADSLSNVPDSVSAHEESSDSGEAGGILANEAKPEPAPYNWIYLALGAVAIAVISSVATRALSNTKKNPQPIPVIPEPLPEEPTGGAAAREQKTPAAETKKLRAEIKALTAQVQELQGVNATLDRNLDIYRNFDSGYFNEAFRKLIVPMNEAIEKGSEKETIETLIKIMGHFSSLTRYKISKKQPYDEANIHYMLNQKGSSDQTAVDITGHTPPDKIPKHIKVILDLLKQQGSNGLDDSIIAGYKIKDL